MAFLLFSVLLSISCHNPGNKEENTYFIVIYLATLLSLPLPSQWFSLFPYFFFWFSILVNCLWMQSEWRNKRQPLPLKKVMKQYFVCFVADIQPVHSKRFKGGAACNLYIHNQEAAAEKNWPKRLFVLLQAYELSTLTGTQVMLLVASETGHVYTFATRKLQPMITSEAGKALIQTCLNSPDPCPSGSGGDQRMSATGFEETELSYNIGDEEQKVRQLVYQNPPSHAQHFQQHHSPHHQHHMMIPPHPHSQIPCSSPGPMLGSGYSQQCPSPYPSSHPHMH